MWMLVADFRLSQVRQHAYVDAERGQRGVAAIDSHCVRCLDLLNHAARGKARGIKVGSAKLGKYGRDLAGCIGGAAEYLIGLGILNSNGKTWARYTAAVDHRERERPPNEVL